MFMQRGSRVLRRQLQATKAVGRVAMTKASGSGAKVNVGGCMAAAAPRWFSESRRLCAVKPVLLADIGEGECPPGFSARRGALTGS